MKKVILLSAIAFAFTFSACNSSSSDKTGNDSTKVSAFDTTKLSKGTAFYQCPMDPDQISDKPGVCSKCKMDLEKVEKK